MADNRTMAQMLQAPIEGYEDAIVVPPINANNFELKQPLINLVQPTNLRTVEARDWFDKEPPRSILTWDDPCLLVNVLSGFSVLHQLDYFFTTLCISNDQDALDLQQWLFLRQDWPQRSLDFKFRTLPIQTVTNPRQQIKAFSKGAKLELEGCLTPTRMTLEACQSFHFSTRFGHSRVDVEGPFLRTAKALIDLYEEKLTLRVGKDELVYYADKSEKNKDKNCVHAISIIDFSKEDLFSGS
ncbi:hypothetical protein Tco_0034088 [Tanacetum coccineum]